MGRLADNQHWALMARPVFAGAVLIGPDLRNILAAALEDAAAYRRDQGYCAACPNPVEANEFAEIGLGRPPKCGDHKIDDAMADAYEYALRRVGALRIEPEDHLRAVLARGLAIMEDPDGPN